VLDWPCPCVCGCGSAEEGGMISSRLRTWEGRVCLEGELVIVFVFVFVSEFCNKGVYPGMLEY